MPINFLALYVSKSSSKPSMNVTMEVYRIILRRRDSCGRRMRPIVSSTPILAVNTITSAMELHGLAAAWWCSSEL